MTAMAVAPFTLDAETRRLRQLSHMKQRAEREFSKLTRDPHLTRVQVEYAGAFNDPDLIAEVVQWLESLGWTCSYQELPPNRFLGRSEFLSQGHLARTIITLACPA